LAALKGAAAKGADILDKVSTAQETVQRFDSGRENTVGNRVVSPAEQIQKQADLEEF
jgi:hypothetical protein